MVDPWPRASANNRIAFNGQLMQSAQDRYNRGKVITPVLPTQASKDYQADPAAGCERAVGDRHNPPPRRRRRRSRGPTAALIAAGRRMLRANAV